MRPDVLPPIESVSKILKFLGEKPREGMEETPLRFLKAMREMTSGYDEDPKSHLMKEFNLSDSERKRKFGGLILSGGLDYVSMCEHHMLPFEGQIHIGYIPNTKDEESKVVGLSKLARMADGYAKRFQIQERLTDQIADAVEEILRPVGVAVIVKGRHTCQCYRGVKKQGFMVTSTMTGVFLKEASARQEFFKMIEIGQHDG